MRIIRKRTGGYTLVELIVVFALIGLLMVAAASVVGAYYRVHTKVTSISEAQTLLNTLLDATCAELRSAMCNTEVDMDNLIVNDNDHGVGKRVAYRQVRNNTVQRKEMAISNGVLVRLVDGAEYPFFDEKTYMGNTVTDFEVLVDSTNSKLVTVKIEITNERDQKAHQSDKILMLYN